MRIKEICIQNFRAIREQRIDAVNISMFIGNNGTGKTSVLEAIHFALSPYFLQGKIKHTDFYNGEDEPITIEIEFDSNFKVELPDGYTTQEVVCNKVHLNIKKRERAGARKAFSDLVVITHYFVPIKGKDPSKNGWSILREKSKTHFRFNERLLSITQAKSDEFPRSFYFPKDRGRQLQRGFNSSISSIFEDFNWRFLKSMNKQDEGLRTFFNDKKKFELGILNKIDNKALAKTFDELNTKLNDFNVEDVAMSFMDGGAPFNSAFLSQSFEQLDLSMTNLGSGIEMIVSILLLETLASLSKKNIIILIDEPELHLHPSLQEKLINYLKGISDEKQVFISTHSPYFFKNCTNHENINLLVTQKRDDHVEINPPNALNLFPWSPSWGEINYFAYDLPTVEFHNELYGYLQGISDECWINKFDEWLFSNKIPQNKIWIRNDGKPKESITLMTYIRHTIHHPENTCNNGYTLYDLQSSINSMIKLIKKFKTDRQITEN